MGYYEWNLCKDGEPSFYGKYLVTCKGCDTPQIRLFEGRWDSLAKVIAWMELPNVYKG